MLLDDLQRRDPRKILILKPTALGDVVQTLPLLPALKHRFPAAEIAWVIHAGLTDLLTGHPDLAEIIPYYRHGSWREGAKLLSTLRSRRFDLVIDLQGLLRTGLMTLATGAPIRLGLETAREGSHWTTTHTIAHTGRDVAAWERYLRVLDAVGAERQFARTVFSLSEADHAFAAKQLQFLPKPLIAVHPGARWETKRWPVEKFAELLRRATDQWDAGVVILGSPAEKPDAAKLFDLLTKPEESPASPGNAATQIQPARGSRAFSTTRVLNLTGQTTLKQLAALLQRADAVVSNDSGPMHLAAGLGTPTLGIFTCTDAVRSGPAGPQHETVSTRVACAASYCKQCPQQGAAHLACFQELDVDRVWSALQRLMRKSVHAACA